MKLQNILSEALWCPRIWMLALVAVADAFMLGGMDQNYMSAVSLATQIQFIQNMFGGQPDLAQLGKRRYQNAG